MLVWLPDAGAGSLLGPLPGSVEVAVMPAAGEPAAGADSVEFLVLGPAGAARLAELLPSLRRLRVVQTLNAGVDWIPPLPPGILLCNASGVHDGPVSEWVLAAVLAMQKRFPHYLEQQRRGRWTAGNLAFGAGPAADDLAESTVIIVGYGSIGAAVEHRLAAFGARTVRVARHEREGVAGPAALPDLVSGADVVILLAPATAETRRLVDAAFLARMRPGALLVNTSRGSLVDTDALLQALSAGRVRAALDATDPEPLPAGHPLWSTPGVLVTPHVAGSSARWLERAYQLAGEQLRRFAAGRPLVNVRTHGY